VFEYKEGTFAGEFDLRAALLNVSALENATYVSLLAAVADTSRPLPDCAIVSASRG
jgi:hypothetical protein